MPRACAIRSDGSPDPFAAVSTAGYARLALARQQVVKRHAPLFRRLGLLAVVLGIALVTVGMTTR
jgi:hypothetical protein